MRSFVEWADDPESGFQIADIYDEVTNTWQGGGRLKLQEIQRRILGYCLTPDASGKFPFTTIVYSCPKKSGKTTIGAAIGAWGADELPARSQIFTLANSEDQSINRVFADISHDAQVSHGLMPFKSEIIFDNGTTVQAIASMHKTAAGSRHAMTIWDELWGYQSEKARQLWKEMQPISTVPHSFRVVVTYAGVKGESDLLEGLYNSVKDNGEVVEELKDIVDINGDPVCYKYGRIFMYWDHEPRMPWQTKEYYEEVLLDPSLRPADFLQLHRNEWVTGLEEFINMSMWRRCEVLEKPLDFLPTDPRRKLPLVLAIDVGTRHDCTAVVGTYFDRERGVVGLAFHRIWTPVPGKLFDIEGTAEQSVIAAQRDGFNVVAVVYDPSQFARSAKTLDDMGFNMIEFAQQGSAMVRASENLYRLIASKSIEMYSDPEIHEHVEASVAVQTPAGTRITKTDSHGRGKPNDFVIALAMAAYISTQNQGVDVSEPIRIEMPFAEESSMPYEDRTLGLTESQLPWMFREDNR